MHYLSIPLTLTALFTVLIRRYRSYWGFYRPSKGERAKALGFPQADHYISSIGISPFSADAITLTSYTVGLADSDFNLHLSNSVYAKNLDHARMSISMEQFGQLFRVTGFNALLGGTSFMFLKEVSPAFV